GTTLVQSAFNNYGLIDLQTGALQMNASFLNTGVVTLAPGTTNQLTGGGSSSGSFMTPASALTTWIGSAFTPQFTLNPGAQLNGAGLYRIDGTTVNFNTGIAMQNLDLLVLAGSGNTALNGTGNLTISNSMNWLAGGSSMGGSGTTIIPPGATLNV